MSTLYVVGTPIGNLKDITMRAIEVLKSVDLILCEDTRVTKRLLNHYAIIDKQLTTYNEQRSGIAMRKVLDLLREGKNMALVSDAGTPGISDPGCMLVAEVRKQVPDCNIVSVPGPSALTAILSISGIPSSEFVFLGFLPHKKGRETLFKEMTASERPVVFYESPHRIEKALLSLQKFCPEKKIYIGRELTKMFEEMVSGTAEDLLKYFKENTEKVRGEFVVVVR